ncbi:hypothetical protein P8452_37313 [Trifolium repens]|nr:hypothetical protein P8452_37313 [Trifolium repens]
MIAVPQLGANMQEIEIVIQIQLYIQTLQVQFQIFFKEAMSERNKSNKAKQVINHICGRKSFQAISYHARDPDTGKEPNFQDLWQMTHMKNSGEWVDGASIEKFI